MTPCLAPLGPSVGGWQRLSVELVLPVAHEPLQLVLLVAAAHKGAPPQAVKVPQGCVLLRTHYQEGPQGWM